MHNLLKFIPLLAVVAFTGNAMGGCGKSVTDKNNSDTDDRLFDTNKQIVYECDSNLCPYGSYVLSKPGYSLNGTNINEESVYKCEGEVFLRNDIWKKQPFPECDVDFYENPHLNEFTQMSFENIDFSKHTYYMMANTHVIKWCKVTDSNWLDCKKASDNGVDVYWNTDAKKCYCRPETLEFKNGECTNRSDNGDSQNNNGGGNNEDGGKNTTFCPFTKEGFSSTITVPSNCSAPNQFVGAIEVVKDYVTKFELKYKTIGYTEYMAASPKPEILCGKCIESGDSNPCMRAIADGESVVWNGTQCLCVGQKAGYDWDQKQGKCIQQQQHKSCVEQRGCATMPSPAREACQLCCNAKKDVATWDKSTRQCNCTNGAVFDINAQSGKWCEAKQQSNFTCPPDSELDAWEHEFATNNAIMNIITDIRNRCSDGNITEPQYNRYKDQIRALIANSKVDDLSGKLSDMQAKFTTSHWTDKEGNFNKKRLLSDSIAATVLGTTGGLITSHIMKKKQAENGFDALQCTVNGQSVASWGDEFTVGIQ